MKINKYLKASTMYFIGNIFDKAVAFITVPIFTRLLNTADYGVTTTYLSWISILSVIITLSLGNSVRNAVSDYSKDIDGYISSIFALGTISGLIISVVIVIGALIMGNAASLKLIVLCCAQAYASSILSTVQWRYMMEVRYIKRTLIQCVPNIVIIIFSIIWINSLETNKYMGRIYSYAIVYVVTAAGYLLIYFYKGRTFYNKRYWRYALSFSLPIIFHSLSTVVLSQADRTMITWLKNSSETGIYGLAYQFGMIPLVFTTTFENIWIPWFSERMNHGDKDSINKMVKPYINTIMVLCAGVMLIAPEVLKIMTTKEYYSAVDMIAPVVLAIFFMFLASISLDLEYYLKKTKSIAFNTLIAAVINIVLNWIFIPEYGAVAAAYTTVVSYAVSFGMHYIIARKMDNELFPFKVYIISIISILFFTIITTVLMDYAVIRWAIGLVLGLIFIVLGSKFIRVKNK